MSTEREPPPDDATAPPGAALYALNPAAAMSTGKTIAQVAHAAVMAADTDPAWGDRGCPAVVLAPDRDAFAATLEREDCLAKVVDAGLTEVPPGTVTVAVLRADEGV